MHTAGPPGAPPVLLVHGWAQSARCWQHQLADPELAAECRLAAMDLRGHGCSDRPLHGYDDAARWADDVHAVLAGLGPAVLVGWSYGGLVIADYLGRYGAGRVSGVLLTGAITGIGRGVPAGRIGPVMRAALPDALADDPATAVPALDAFVAGLAATPLGGEQHQALLGTALATPPRVRAALFARHSDGGQLVRALDAEPRPVLVQHGTHDGVVDRATAEHHLATLPGARPDWWDGAGHLAFAEDPARFNRTLLRFVRQCTTDREKMTR